MPDNALLDLLSGELANIGNAQLAAACQVVVAGYKAEDLGTTLGRDTDPSVKTLILYARAEIYKLLCTENKQYESERQAILALKASFVGFLTGAMIMKFGISEGTAAAIAAVALFLPVKLGWQAWCNMYKDTSLSRVEQKALVDKVEASSSGEP